MFEKEKPCKIPLMEILLQPLLELLQSKQIPFSQERIEKAFEIAKKAHEGQTRSTGEPYITHPLGVAMILTEVHCDESMIIAALLHDVVEDTEVTLEDIEKIFGEEIKSLVEGLTKIAKVESIGLDRQLVSIRRMFLAMAKDIRVIYVKLADRLHNIRTIDSFRQEKQIRIAEETLYIYAPIATRLGIYYFKNELEEICFRVLHPKEYQELKKQMSSYNKNEEQIAETSVDQLERRMERDSAPYISVSWREKSLYSIFRKLQKRKESDLSNIYDIFAIRVITDSVENCYKILGVIHKYWKPLSNRFKDYIAVPKSNGYQSLHTTVLGLGKSGTAFKPVEIQIRTQEMHDHAEVGTAAHWSYKDGSMKTDWIQSLVSLADEIQSSSDEFISNVKEDILGSRIFVITPKGDIKDLPNGATPIDFAYSIHTDIGNHLESCRINGKIVPLDSPLKNGDIVEVKINKNRTPNPAWVNVVKTNQARSMIKQWLKLQSQENLLKLGRDEINKFLKKMDQEPLDKEFSVLKEFKGKNLSLREREDLVAQVGEGSQKASDVLKHLFQTPEQRSVKKVQPLSIEGVAQDSMEIFVMGDTSFETRLSSCCKPDPSQKITGFITRGGYVSIHALSCPFVINAKEDRFVECHWANEEIPFEIAFTFVVSNKVGVISRILRFFSDNNLNVLTIDAKTNRARGIGNDIFVVETKELDKLSWYAEHLAGIDGVIEVDYRVINR